MTDDPNIYSRLGRIEGTVQHLDDRFDGVDAKLDKLVGLAADVEHLKANVKMMKEPVEDYKSVKNRALGMWMLGTFVLAAVSTASTFISYLLRAFVFKIGSP